MYLPKKDNGLEPDRVGAIARIAAKKSGRDGKHTPLPVYDGGGDVDTPPEVKIEPEQDKSPMPWLNIRPVMPRRASVRETIDSPEILAGIESLYKSNLSSFSPIQGNMGHYSPEVLVPIDVEGHLGSRTEGKSSREGDGSMHVNARVPKSSIAVIHTHPYGEKPETSSDDETVANTLQRPNYALSGNAIYVAEPGNKESRKVADLKYKNGHLIYDWKDVPIPEPAKAPVYDRGGDVDVNDGHHQLAVLEDGERVLTPKEAEAYRRTHGAKEPNMKTTMPKILETTPVYDEGGDVKEQPKLKPIVIPASDLDNAVQESNSSVEPSTSESTEKLIPAPESEKAPQEQPTQGHALGQEWLKRMGVKSVEPITSDVAGKIEERPVAALPKIEVPRETHQETAGGPLIPGAPSSETPNEQRDLRNMERRAKVVDLEKQRQDALASGDLTTADKLAVAKAQLEKTPWADRSTLGKIGQVASIAGNIAGDIVNPNIMALIPGTALNRAMKERAAFNRIPIESETDAREAIANTKEATHPKPLPGESNTAVGTDGTRYQRYEMPDGSTQWAAEGTVPHTTVAARATTSGLPTISVPGNGGLPAGAVIGKPAGEPKAETREQHLNRYAELKNTQESRALNPDEQKEFNTLRTELTVPPNVIAEHNKAIDNALRKAGVPQDQWADYHVQPGATSEEDKEATTQARTFASETYQQGAEDRTIDKEDRAQKRKDQSTTVYAEDTNGQLIKTTKFDAEKLGLSYEEMKPGDINKDRQALRMLNDVQINTSRYTKAASAYDAASLTEEQRKVDRDNISKMLNKAGWFDTEAAISEGGHITVPILTAKAEAMSRQERSDEYKHLSPEAKELFDGYIRTMAAVPAYQKSLTGIGRSNKEMLDLELANIANPTMDPKDILRKQKQFQENIDQATAGFPNNLPGVKHPSETRRETEKSSGSAQSLSVEAPNGVVYNFKTKAEADAFRKKAGL